MSPDLRLATIYVMPLGGRDEEEVLDALERNKRYMRGEIARRVNLKFAPEIRFRIDERFDEAERIEKLLRTPEVRRDLAGEKDDVMAAPAFPPLAGSPAPAEQERTARASETEEAAEARRARLARARQAGRHDLDPRRVGDQAAVHRQARRPCRHARSAGLRLPADRARRGDQDRAVRGRRPQDLSFSPSAGARSATPTMPRAAWRRRARCGPTRRRSARCCRASPAPSSRCRRASRRSRSTASAPTISPARARRSSSSRAR